MEESREKMQQDMAETLRSLRARSGLSQRELAERAGFSRSQYAYYEVGKILPDLFSLKKIAEALKLDISALFSPERDAGVAE